MNGLTLCAMKLHFGCQLADGVKIYLPSIMIESLALHGIGLIGNTALVVSLDCTLYLEGFGSMTEAAQNAERLPLSLGITGRKQTTHNPSYKRLLAVRFNSIVK